MSGEGKKKFALVDVCEIVPVSECSLQNVQLRLVSLALRFYAVTKAVPGLRFKATLFKFCTSSYGLFTLRYGQRRQSCPGRDIPASVARTRTADGPGASPPRRVRAGEPHKHLSHRLVSYVTAYSPAKARHLPKPPTFKGNVWLFVPWCRKSRCIWTVYRLNTTFRRFSELRDATE